MVKPADVSTKRLISLAPDNWVRWVTAIPNINVREILNSEFQWISRESEQRVAGVPHPRHLSCPSRAFFSASDLSIGSWESRVGTLGGSLSIVVAPPAGLIVISQLFDSQRPKLDR